MAAPALRKTADGPKPKFDQKKKKKKANEDKKKKEKTKKKKKQKKEEAWADEEENWEVVKPKTKGKESGKMEGNLWKARSLLSPPRLFSFAFSLHLCFYLCLFLCVSLNR